MICLWDDRQPSYLTIILGRVSTNLKKIVCLAWVIIAHFSGLFNQEKKHYIYEWGKRNSQHFLLSEPILWYFGNFKCVAGLSTFRGLCKKNILHAYLSRINSIALTTLNLSKLEKRIETQREIQPINHISWIPSMLHTFISAVLELFGIYPSVM